MAMVSIADRYRAAGLNPGAATLDLRQEPFEKLCKNIDSRSAIELTRLYFGLPSQNDTKWFRDEFFATDSSFSMVENKREIAVLAACLLDAGFESGIITCALAPLSAAAAGHRSAEDIPDLLNELDRRLISKAVEARDHDLLDPATIAVKLTNELPADVPALVQAIGNDWTKAAGIIKQVNDGSGAAVKALAKQTKGTLGPLYNVVSDLREEVALLWWHVGGWSRLLNVPFGDLPVATAAMLIGLDVADLSRTLVGPAAARALMQRSLTAGREGPIGRVTIAEAVAGLPDDGAAATLTIHRNKLHELHDICPLLTAVDKARESGLNGAWHPAFRRATGLSENIDFSGTDLCIQAFRERMILYSLAD